MIKADIAEIENLTAVLVKLASDADETSVRLRQLFGEMQEDIVLPLYPQADVALEALSVATEALNRGNDTLQTLKNAMLPIADAYRENEKKNKDALNRMAMRMANLEVGYNAAISSDGVAYTEQEEEEASRQRLRQLVADNLEEMQIANIAAVTKTVKEEYEITEVKPLLEQE